MHEKFPFHRPGSKGGRITFKLYETFGENPFSFEEAKRTLIKADFDRIDYLPNHLKFLIEHKVLEKKDADKYIFTVGQVTEKDSNVGNYSPIGYLPTKADIEFAYSQLRKMPGEGIGTEDALNQVEVNFNKEGKPLKPKWRQITRENIKIWFGKKKKE